MVELVVALGITVAAAVAAWYGYGPRQIRRRLRAAPPSRIADLPEAVAGRIVGTAVAIQPMLQAPLTGRPCIAYEVTVSSQVGRPFACQSSCMPFVLVDDSGRALVRPAGGKVTLVRDHREEGSRNGLTDAQRFVLRDLSLMPGGTAVFEEGIVEPGGRVAVLGAGMREPDPDAEPDEAYRGTQRLRLVLASSRRLRIYISNDPSTTS